MREFGEYAHGHVRFGDLRSRETRSFENFCLPLCVACFSADVEPRLKATHARKERCLSGLHPSLFWRRESGAVRYRRIDRGRSAGCWRDCGWRRDQNGFRGLGKLVGVGYQERYLPHLGLGEFLAETGHSGKAETVKDLPIALGRFVVGHALAFEQERRARIHAFGDGCFLQQRQAMADGAMLFIEFSTGQIVGFGGLDGNDLSFLFVDAGVLSPARKKLFEGHIRVGGGDGRAAASEIQVCPEGHYGQSDQQSDEEFHDGIPSQFRSFYNLTLEAASKLAYSAYNFPETGGAGSRGL